ncbi:hypothetical protein AGMMS50267_03950 [Spirochaetia bacterium]|nr:hypothetical protein AGMMS50267_03950 [Spirochaetia bacterium]
MKFSKTGLSLLGALVFFSFTCVLVYASYQKVKKEQAVIASGKQATQLEEPSYSGTLSVLVSDTAGKSPADQARLVNASRPQKIIEIKEKMFIAQVNDVYLNQEDYLGKTIKLEGLFKAEQYDENAPPYCFVLRYGPGCCGSDGNAGFEVAWNKETAAVKAYPNVDDWVEAVGILQTYEEGGGAYLYLALSELTVLDKRGAEYVAQ